MDLPSSVRVPAALEHESVRTALATVASGTLLLLAIVLVLFVLPYLLVSGL